MLCFSSRLFEPDYPVLHGNVSQSVSIPAERRECYSRWPRLLPAQNALIEAKKGRPLGRPSHSSQACARGYSAAGGASRGCSSLLRLASRSSPVAWSTTFI